MIHRFEFEDYLEWEIFHESLQAEMDNDETIAQLMWI
jgi:hypothetical protein